MPEARCRHCGEATSRSSDHVCCEDYQAVHDLRYPPYIVIELPTGKVSYTRNRFFRGGYEPGGFVAFLVLFFIAYMYADVVWRALMWE
jgi:hypothetical protein